VTLSPRIPLATEGTTDEVQWKLFGLIGPAAVYCAEAAFWLDGTVGGQIGVALQKQFLTWSVGQQLLASWGSAITGKWVLYRKLLHCAISGSNNTGCKLGPLDVTIACSGTAYTIIRANGGSDFAPWDHSIPSPSAKAPGRPAALRSGRLTATTRQFREPALPLP
jgi:hypothetical protein